MKVMNAFIQLFAIFAFLTLGSLLIIVASRILSLEDALFKLKELYSSPWKSVQTGLVGLLFILVGLAFTKIMLKKGRDQEALIFQSEMGPIVVSYMAIEDVAKKALKRFHIVKDSKIKTVIRGKNVEVKIRLHLWSGAKISELLLEIQEDVLNRVRKLLGSENKLEVICDVLRIEDFENESHKNDEAPHSAAS